MNDGADPRLESLAHDAGLTGASEPVVGAPAGRTVGIAIMGGFVLFAVILFLVLNGRRTANETRSLVVPAAEVTANASPPPPPLQMGPPPSKSETLPPAPQRAPRIAPAAPLVATPVVPIPDPMQRRRAPSVVVDLGLSSAELAATPVAAIAERGAGATAPAASPSTMASPAAPASVQGLRTNVAAPAGLPAAAGRGGLATLGGQNALGSTTPFGGGTDQFARRVGDEEPGEARATMLPHLDTLIPQGTVIPAVLETAIDSDLPGFTRAIVSRDVRNFDGKTVLIPRGSRLIGQYKSAVALGDTRAFIIWTRIIRPDGVSILIGSPGGDALGRGGLDGDVDTHFFARFGGSILLSVLSAGVAAIGGVPTTQVTIGSPGAAVGAASTVASGDSIPPTVKVPQGVAVRIFVARDLDFSGVGPVK